MANWHKDLNEEVLDAAASLYGVGPEQLKKLGGFENVVYEMSGEGSTAILRFSHTDHRSPELIQAELDWVLHLAECEVNVCKPLASPSGKLVEIIHSEGGQFMATAFRKAPGSPVHAGHTDWGPALFAEWGRITGQMHACARKYVVPDGAPARKRSGSSANSSSTDNRTYGPAAVAYSRYREAAEQIRALQGCDNDSYGLCHRDLHQGNFFVHEGEITAFDFDDCGYDYFVQDIAMAVYYGSIFPSWSKPVYDDNLASEFANRFLDHFMDGYGKHNSLSDRWLKQLPLFIEKRRSDLCVILHDAWTTESSNSEQREWLRWNLDAISRDVPCFRLDV